MSCCFSSCCDTGRSKSTYSLWLGLELDKSKRFLVSHSETFVPDPLPKSSTKVVVPSPLPQPTVKVAVPGPLADGVPVPSCVSDPLGTGDIWCYNNRLG